MLVSSGDPRLLGALRKIVSLAGMGMKDWLPTEAKQGWAGQNLDGRSPGKTRLLLEEVLVRLAGGAHPVVCVGPNAPV